MKTGFVVPALLAACLGLTSGCASFSKGSKQTVVVRSVPEGAVGVINGVAVGKTPFKVELKRTQAYTINLQKAGFATASATVLPVANEYEKRFFRWGIDYELGAMTDLIPNDFVLELRPATPEGEIAADRFHEMSYRILQADALLASKQISPSYHRYLTGEIVKLYTN